MLRHPFIGGTGRLAQVQSLPPGGFTQGTNQTVVDPLFSTADALPFCGLACEAQFSSAASVNSHPRIFIDDLAGDLATSLLNIFGPGNTQEFGDFIVLILELFSEGGTFGEGDEYHGLHLSTILLHRRSVWKERFGRSSGSDFVLVGFVGVAGTGAPVGLGPVLFLVKPRRF